MEQISIEQALQTKKCGISESLLMEVYFIKAFCSLTNPFLPTYLSTDLQEFWSFFEAMTNKNFMIFDFFKPSHFVLAATLKQAKIVIKLQYVRILFLSKRTAISSHTCLTIQLVIVLISPIYAKSKTVQIIGQTVTRCNRVR